MDDGGQPAGRHLTYLGTQHVFKGGRQAREARERETRTTATSEARLRAATRRTMGVSSLQRREKSATTSACVSGGRSLQEREAE